MIVGSTKEILSEKRVSITPDTTKSFKDLGLNIILEKGYGEKLGFKESDYKKNGAEFLDKNLEVIKKSNLICKVSLPSEEELKVFNKNSSLVVGNLKEKSNNLMETVGILKSFTDYGSRDGTEVE